MSMGAGHVANPISCNLHFPHRARLCCLTSFKHAATAFVIKSKQMTETKNTNCCHLQGVQCCGMLGLQREGTLLELRECAEESS